MAYLLALLYLACIYIRPAEIIAGWEAVPFAGIVAALSAVSVGGSLVLRPRRFWDLPQDWFVLGFLIAIVRIQRRLGMDEPERCTGSHDSARDLRYFLVRTRSSRRGNCVASDRRSSR